MTYIWSNRYRSVSISWKLVVIPKISPFLNFRTTFKTNLTCIFLSVGLKLLSTFQYEMPCSKNPNENRGLIAFELCKYVLQFKLSVVSTSDHLAWYRRLIKKIKKHRKEYFLIILTWVFYWIFLGSAIAQRWDLSAIAQ